MVKYVFAVLAFICLAPTVALAAGSPNVIVIFADDQG